MAKVRILSIDVDRTTKAEVVNKVKELLGNKKKFYIVTPNPEIALLAHKDPKLAKIINEADLSIPDGVGFKLADPSLSIIKGRELMGDLLNLSNKLGLRVYLLGATKEANFNAIAKVTKSYPNIKLKGASGPIVDEFGIPKTEADKRLETSVVDDINNLKPDLLFVAYGAPKQEFWTASWLSDLDVSGVMVVGGSLDSMGRERSLVFDIMSHIGFEWLYRLVLDPGRIGRIMNALVVFPLTLLKHKLF